LKHNKDEKDMKKIFLMAFAGLALMSLVACSDSDYDEKYADPSKTTTVGVPQVFTGIMYKGNTWMDPIYWRYYTQSTTSGTFSGVIGNSNGKGRYRGASEGYFNIRWQNFYDMLAQFRLLEKNYNALSEDEKPANTIFYYLGRTLVESQLHEVLSLWGDVPFTGAGTLWDTSDYNGAKTLCVYDDDVTLYKQILSDLKEVGDYFAAGNLNAAGLSSLTRQDYTTAAGSSSLWQKYVNSLRLRIALHLATNGDCVADAKAAIAEILNNPSKYPLIDSNAENMGVKASTKTDDFNFGKSMAQALAGRGEGSGSQAMLDAMNVPSTGIPDANTDPRIAAIYDCNPDGEYVAYNVKLSDTENSNISDAKNKEYIARGIKSANYYCYVDSEAVAGYASYQGNSNLNGIWVSAAEVSLSKAEAYLMGYGVTADAAKAKTNFLQGVQQSIEYYWNIKTTSSLYKAGNDSYNGYRALTVPTTAEITAYAEKIWKPTQECVATQLWLNFGFMNELEAWNVTRRTGYPSVQFATDTQVSSYPTPPNRLPYPSDELNYNATNVQAAIAKNYEETTGYYTNLFWAKKTYYNLVK
jgi:hypothetical protein